MGLNEQIQELRRDLDSCEDNVEKLTEEVENLKAELSKLKVLLEVGEKEG